MKQKPFKIDLAKIDGEGDFPCPRCGTVISPDDESETLYTIIDIVMSEDDIPENMVIRCNKCSSIINLEGFDALSIEEDSRIGISESLPTSQPGFRTNHNLSLNGKLIGNVMIEYMQEEDVEAFKKVRTLHAGDPFKGTFTLIKSEDTNVNNEDLLEIVKVAKRKFKGLRDSDIYFVELKNGQKNFIGRASNLQSMTVTE